MSADVGFVGLGVMGSRMARHLVDAGLSLAVHDVRADAVDQLVAAAPERTTACSSARAVADAAPLVLVSLPTPDVVRSVAEDVAGGARITTFCDLSTTGPDVAREVAARLAAIGIGVVDAPVSGGLGGAERGLLTVMAAGASQHFATVEPILRHFAKDVFLVGPEPGHGQLAKVINNLLSATALQVTAEAVVLGVARGLDPAVLVAVVNASSGRNSATLEKLPKFVFDRGFDSGFRLDLMAKDVALCVDQGHAAAVPMPIGDAVAAVWTAAAAAAAPGEDHTEIVRRVERAVGVTIEPRPVTAP